MPYSGPDDPNLPTGVKKKSDHDRAIWVGVFNSVYKRTGDDGRAMREAYGQTKEMPEVTRIIGPGEKAGRVLSGRNIGKIRDTMDKLRDLLKGAGIDDEIANEQVKAFGAKCGVYDEGGTYDTFTTISYEGAKSFEDLDAREKAFATRDGITNATRQFQIVFSNIMADDSMSPDDRAAAVAVAAADYSERAGNKEQGFVARLKSLFGSKAEADDETQESMAHQHDDESGETITHSHPCAMDDGHQHPGMSKADYSGTKENDHHDERGRFASRTSGSEIDNYAMFRNEGRPPKKKPKGEKATKTEGGEGGFTPADYADVPDESSPSTWKLRLSDHPGHHDVTHVAGAITALQPGGFRGQKVDLGGRKATAISKISAAITKLDAPDDTKSNLRDRLSAVKAYSEYGETGFGAFTAFKDTAGKWRWLATWSNNFYDREGEVFPESSHKDYIEYVDRTGDFPELWLWHVPGSKCGKADMIDYDNGFCIATGTFDANKGVVAERLSRAKGLGVSHGYDYDIRDLRGGAYNAYRSFEISPLPAERAANEGTAFAAMKEAPMLTTAKRDWLVQTVGEDVTKEIEANHLRMRKSLEDRGVNFKEFIEGVNDALNGDTKVIYAPGFKSTDGGKTWTTTNAKGGGGGGGEKPDDEEEKTDDDEAAEGEAAGDGDAAEGGDGEKAIGMKAITAAVTKAMEPIVARLDAQDEKLEALKESDDAKIAAAWQRSGDKARQIKSVTDSEDNIRADGELVTAAMGAMKEANGDDNPAAPYLQDLMRMVGAAPATAGN